MNYKFILLTICYWCCLCKWRLLCWIINWINCSCIFIRLIKKIDFSLLSKNGSTSVAHERADEGLKTKRTLSTTLSPSIRMDKYCYVVIHVKLETWIQLFNLKTWTLQLFKYSTWKLKLLRVRVGWGWGWGWRGVHKWWMNSWTVE
jgi:hypothetical protein